MSNKNEETVRPGDFSGSDYDPAIDFVRLKGQMLRVYACLQPRNEWWTLREIEEETGDPQASISAQLRNLRKEKFGGHTIERRRRASCVDTTGSTIVGGQWEYRLNDGLLFECHQCDGKFAEEEVNRQWTHDPYATGDSPSVFEYTCPSCGSFYIDECDRQQG